MHILERLPLCRLISLMLVGLGEFGHYRTKGYVCWLDFKFHVSKVLRIKN